MKGVPQLLAQDWFEFSQMLNHVRGVKSILEIGSRFGQSLARMALVSDVNSKLVTVDLPVDPYSIGADVHGPLTAECEKLRLHGHEVHQITGDSHYPDVADKVRALGPYDFGFIDGDHTYSGARQDWLEYGPMCQIVAFHDINCPDWGVKNLWNDIKHDHPYAEYIGGEMGIGVLFRNIKKFQKV